MSAAHTRGPWSCAGGYGNHGLCITGPDGEALGHVRAFIPSGEIRHGAPVQMAWPEGQANARLIAAAPLLLESLQNLVGLARMGAAPVRDYKAALADADAAIKKATGAA
jgi:hypothetical protein